MTYLISLQTSAVDPGGRAGLGVGLLQVDSHDCGSNPAVGTDVCLL